MRIRPFIAAAFPVLVETDVAIRDFRRALRENKFFAPVRQGLEKLEVEP